MLIIAAVVVLLLVVTTYFMWPQREKYIGVMVYLKNRHPKPNQNCLHLTQVEVLDGDKNIALEASAAASSVSAQYSPKGPEAIIDGDKSTFIHTNCTGDQWLRVDFPQPTAFDSVVVHNLKGPVGGRLQGAEVRLLKADGTHKTVKTLDSREVQKITWEA